MGIRCIEHIRCSTNNGTDDNRIFFCRDYINARMDRKEAKTMQVAVIDDEQKMRIQLEKYILRFGQENEEILDVTLFSSADELLKQNIAFFDLLIFDIDMPGTNGMDAARHIRQNNEEIVILFVTNIAQYAINGYEVDAVDYILKPVGYFDFAMKFLRAVKRAKQKNNERLVLSTTEGQYAVNVRDILYVEVIAHYLIYHTAEKEYRIRASMREHEDILKKYFFSRCHKSYLINLRRMKGIHNTEVLVDSLSIPLGRTYKDSLLSDYIRFLHQ